MAVTAIDAPLGWPAGFVQSLAAYGAGGPFPDPGEDLWLRATDRVVWAAVGRRPLSVSSDRIAYPAVRAARLLSRLGPGRPACRDGSDGIIEVYPVGALAAWGIDPGRYKRPDALDVRRNLLTALMEALPELDLGGREGVLVATDHALDALVAALVARAHAIGQARPPSGHEADLAATEGWIWLPDRPIGLLTRSDRSDGRRAGQNVSGS